MIRRFSTFRNADDFAKTGSRLKHVNRGDALPKLGRELPCCAILET